jgi:RND family efflux transporter MFP subunit
MNMFSTKVADRIRAWASSPSVFSAADALRRRSGTWLAGGALLLLAAFWLKPDASGISPAKAAVPTPESASARLRAAQPTAARLAFDGLAPQAGMPRPVAVPAEDLPGVAGLAQAPLSGVEAADRQVRGVVRPVHDAILSSSISARIVSMPYREGDVFARGAVLVRFDCARQTAELEAARAAAAAEKAQFDSQSELLRLEAAGKTDVQIARERHVERNAQAAALEHAMAGCTVTAPFAGRVVEHFARMHETPTSSAQLLRIVSHSQVELQLVAPSRWLAWLEPGTRFQFQVDETGATVRARVKSVNPSVDPVSQTVKLLGVLDEARAATVLPGMSGSATFDRRRDRAQAVAVTR